MRLIRSAAAFAALLVLPVPARAADPPPAYDLRDSSLVTAVKRQSGGTCWAHATMAALEGNLLRTGVWEAEGETGEPDLAEYHLDWWNGFNRHWNGDLEDPSASGLTVHQGGDYLVAAAYLARGEGAVRNGDGQSYETPPPRDGAYFRRYAPRHIEWLTGGGAEERIDRIKRAVMAHGPVATCMLFDPDYMHGFAHYQPPGVDHPPNHAVAIIGWDDGKETAAPERGAWLCKNSHGADWGLEGCFWIAYGDRWCGSEPWMGAVRFRDVRRTGWDRVYGHDLHGWRDVLDGVKEARARFVAGGDERIGAVGFVTAAPDAAWEAFLEEERTGALLGSASGIFARPGVHVVDLDRTAGLPAGTVFHVRVRIAAGGHAFDRTSEVPVLLGASGRPLVESRARPGECEYRAGGRWLDLTGIDSTASFCIKAYARSAGLDISPANGFHSSGPVGGPFQPALRVYTIRSRSAEDVPYAVRLDPPVPWIRLGGATEGILPPDSSARIFLALDAAAAGLPEGAHRTALRFTEGTDGLGDQTLPVALTAGDPPEIVRWAMDEDPGWTMDEGWAWGAPAGGGGETGGPDPSSGYSGACVVGFALEGDYVNDLPARRVVAGPIDCSGRYGVVLRYRRWLGVEGPERDAASLEISPDGEEWVLLWSNPAAVADTGWVLREQDLSFWADDRPAVRLRWTLGPTDGSGRCCGWNLDDVEIAGHPLAGATGVAGGGAGLPAPSLRIGPVRPNPFNPSAEIRFDLPAPSPAWIAVYDPAGRLVRRLGDGPFPAGAHFLRWDGRDSAGRALPSGVYLIRIETPRSTGTAKAVLLR